MPMQTPEQYLEQCKQRAFVFCDRGDTLGALVSMVNDTTRAGCLATRDEFLAWGNQLLESGGLRTAADVRDFIERFPLDSFVVYR
jgi:hypothetical protein